MFWSFAGQRCKIGSWLLAAVITVAMLCLYYATHTLHGLFPMMSLRLRQGGHNDDVFMVPIRDHLSDRQFIVAGLFFGLMNCGVGFLFGLPKGVVGAHATLYAGFFLAGVVCGMAAWGIFGVTLAVTAFARKVKGGLDCTAPDHCGGVRFLGEGLVVFSSVTLIVGVLISLYILRAPWSNADPNSLWIIVLKWCWIVFPFMLSLAILMGPAVPINDALRQYKVDKETELQEHLAALESRLSSLQTDAAACKAIRDEYAYQQNVREALYAMGTWPHGLSANLKYFGIFLANLIATAATVITLFDKLKVLPHAGS